MPLDVVLDQKLGVHNLQVARNHQGLSGKRLVPPQTNLQAAHLLYLYDGDGPDGARIPPVEAGVLEPLVFAQRSEGSLLAGLDGIEPRGQPDDGGHHQDCDLYCDYATSSSPDAEAAEEASDPLQ